MKIEMLSPDKLKIMLTPEDMVKFNICYDALDYQNQDTKKLVLDLLYKAKNQTGFDSSDGRLFIEVYPIEDGGCVFYFSVINKSDGVKRRYKVKSTPIGPMVFEFLDVDSMINACVTTYKAHSNKIYKSTLYAINNKYRLLVYPITQSDTTVSCTLSEFGNFVGEGELYSSYVNEHGKVILSDDALERVAKCLS